jgi:hypothetical protein
VVVGERQGGKRVGGSKSGSPKSGSGMVGRGSLSSTKIVAPRNGSNRVHATTGGDWCKGWKSGSYDVVVGGRVGWRWSCCRRCVAGVPQVCRRRAAGSQIWHYFDVEGIVVVYDAVHDVLALYSFILPV